MTNKWKRRLLNTAGFIASVGMPVGAAIAVFPREKPTAFLEYLNLSTAAFAVILVIAAITAMRFFNTRIAIPKNGVIFSLLLYFLIRGVRVIIDPFETIAFWLLIGNIAGWICYFIADKKYGEVENNGKP